MNNEKNLITMLRLYYSQLVDLSKAVELKQNRSAQSTFDRIIGILLLASVQDIINNHLWEILYDLASSALDGEMSFAKNNYSFECFKDYVLNDKPILGGMVS